MKKEKEVVELMLDYLEGPIWISDVLTGKPLTGIDVIDKDEEIRKLNYEISNMYSSYYEFDSHDQGCWFNAGQEKKDKYKMLELLKKLNDRLDEINDGTYVVDDRLTEYYKKL